jgi:CheY-like chemotaxis protein
MRDQRVSLPPLGGAVHAGRALVLDDDRHARGAVVRLLRSFGYEVMAAADGLEALELLSQDFDVIISDVDMPGMDGREFKRELDRRRIDVPVVLVSGDPELASVGRELSVVAWIAKPCGAEDLRRALARLEEERRRRAKRREAG